MERVDRVERQPVGEVSNDSLAKKSSPNKKRNKKSLVIGLAVFGIFVVAGFLFALLSSGAEVTVFPRLREPTVNAVLEAKRQNASASELAYEVMTLEAEGAREVTATGQEEVETQATGNITIYNTGSESQRLITNTRFQTKEGLVFRIKDPAVVPAATDGNPGSIVAEVFADEAGEKYNISAGTRLRVPGFQENDMMELYEAIYAENPAAISGGYSGPRFIVDEEQLATSMESLQSELRQALLNRVEGERPAGFTLFDSSVVFVYQDLAPEEIGEGQVRLKQKAILQVPIFKNEDFAAFIAAATVPGYEGEPVRIEDTSKLSFEYVTVPSNILAEEMISFRLSGNPRLIWVFDTEQLKTDLAGGSQSALNIVLGGYPAIEKASATIRPFWKQSFPNSTEEITIVESTDSN
ncbi:MAG: hypothetical protein WDZ56_00445 [Candidatus Paceibacterota bacterium]